MLEARSAYGYYGSAGGVTGEVAPERHYIEKNMKYYEYKKRYPKCDNLGDYDKVNKTITVLLPVSVEDRPNFGNKYRMDEFYFYVSGGKFDRPDYSNYVAQKAKNVENARKRLSSWLKKEGAYIVRECTLSEYINH